MNFGLKDSDFKILQNLVLEPIKNKSFKIYIFGSRATGKNHPFSDIDLLIVPKSESARISPVELALIKESIEESRFPIKVDLVHLEDLASSYREGVLKEKIEI